jgi:hypothetical protein
VINISIIILVINGDEWLIVYWITIITGPRDQLNVATQVLDLSNLYGGNLIDDSLTLRSFKKGSIDLHIYLDYY